MAVHFTFAASKAFQRSVPCVGDSICLADLKDAIAVPLVAALKGKKLKENFDFRVYDAETKQEILGANTTVRKHSSVLVKRVPAFVLSRQKPAVVVESSGLEVTGKSLEKVIDDDFGDDVYSTSTVTSKEVENLEKLKEPEVQKVEKEGRKIEVASNKTVVQSRYSRSTVTSKEVEKLEKLEVEKVEKESRKKEEVVCNKTDVVQSVQAEIPVELMCTLCKNVMKDPVLIPCCCNSFCSDCIKVALVGGNNCCPECESFKCREADLLPNRHIKAMIDVHFKSCNPSAVSSSGSCSSLTSSSRVRVGDLQTTRPSSIRVADVQQTTPYTKDTNQKACVSNGVNGKRKPLVISLTGGQKRTKLL